MGIFWVLLLLMAAVDFNQLLFSSEEKGIVREKERREEILQRLKEQKESLQQLHLRLKNEIAHLEARQEALTRPALAQERKIQQCIHKVLFLAAIMLFKLWNSICRKSLVSTVGRRLTQYFYVKHGKERPSLTISFVLTRGIHIHED